MRRILRQAKRRFFFLLVRFKLWSDVYFSGAEALRFVCNICGTACCVPLSVISRERPSCYGCGSTVRYRSVINALLAGLEISLKPLRLHPMRKTIVGIGMTDSEIYAEPLQRMFSYKNTYYHKEPRLDILSVDLPGDGRADFIICSDVLEHVCPPVGVAFQNLFRLLKPGGVLVLTVPLVEDALAKEHFPNLSEYHFELWGDRRVLINKTSGGSYEEFHDLVFHGGEGETLEMRLFSREWLLEELTKAGFGKIRVMDEEYTEYGILWRQDRSVPILAWK